MIGRTIAHCRIASKLGSGGMGVLHGEPEFERLYPAGAGQAGR